MWTELDESWYYSRVIGPLALKSCILLYVNLLDVPVRVRRPQSCNIGDRSINNWTYGVCKTS